MVVDGEVQGVGYRYTMRIEAEAEAVGVSGWVRNRRDGAVEAEVEGTPEQVDAILAWMAEGLSGARVISARVEDATPTGAPAFEVRPTT